MIQYKELCLLIYYIKKRDYYLTDIVYGDILSDKYMLENTRNKRDCDVIIVNENDSMFLDEYGKSTLLSKEMPYMKRLNYILITIWIYLNNNIQSQFLTIEEKKKKIISEKLNTMGKKILEKIKKNSQLIYIITYLMN